jgi:hypothetical protein
LLFFPGDRALETAVPVRCTAQLETHVQGPSVTIRMTCDQ